MHYVRIITGSSRIIVIDSALSRNKKRNISKIHRFDAEYEPEGARVCEYESARLLPHRKKVAYIGIFEGRDRSCVCAVRLFVYNCVRCSGEMIYI